MDNCEIPNAAFKVSINDVKKMVLSLEGAWYISLKVFLVIA